MTIRYKLDELLRARGLDAKDVAAATGIAESTLSEIRTQRAERIGRKTLLKLCRYFGCQVADLVECVTE